MTGVNRQQLPPTPIGGGDPASPAEPSVRPIGAWVVAGFVVFASITMWALVAVVFYVRS